MKTLLAIFLSMLVFYTESSVLAQSWDWAHPLGNTGNESADDIVVSKNGDLLVAGSFEEELIFGGQTLMSAGEEDIYLARLDKDGLPIWLIGAGGEDVEETRAIGEDAEGNIYWTGTYWREIDFNGQILTSPVGIKAIFVVKYTSDGQFIWARSLSSIALKDIGDLALDTSGNLYLTGYFGGEFVLPGITLNAKGEADLFVVKMNPDGGIIWARATGESGFIRGTNIALDENNGVYVSGYFKGQLAFATDTIKTNTSDNDVFVARFEQGTGDPVWGRKAGGVHEDFSTGLVVDSLGHLYLTGYYYGVLNLGGGVEVQATGFSDNSYLLKYRDTGEALWARTFGGEGLVHSMDLQYRDGELLLGGYFRDNLSIESTSLTAQTDFDTFLATYSAEEGTIRQLWQVPSSGFTLISKLRYLSETDYLVVGSFTQTATFTPLSITSIDAFDAFIARGKQRITSIESTPLLRYPITLFPNPASDRLFIQTDLRDYQVTIINTIGQSLISDGEVEEIDLTLLPAGAYYLLLRHELGQQALPFIKEK